jgi:hypothetical protein
VRPEEVGLYPDFYPLALRWEPSGEVRGLHDRSDLPSDGEDEPEVWICPHPGCEEHIVLASFSYAVDPPSFPPRNNKPLQDTWKSFWLDAYCVRRDELIRVLDHV